MSWCLLKWSTLDIARIQGLVKVFKTVSLSIKNEINNKGKTQQNRSRFFTCGGCDIFYMRQLHDIEWLINPPPSPITGDFCRKIFAIQFFAIHFLLLNSMPLNFGHPIFNVHFMLINFYPFGAFLVWDWAWFGWNIRPVLFGKRRTRQISQCHGQVTSKIFYSKLHRF